MFIFDSRASYFKQPFGAPPAGTPVRLRVHLARRVGAYRVQCCLRADAHPHLQRIDMRWQALQQGYDVYECTFPAPDAGLYWYWFEAQGAAGAVRLPQGDWAWQLSVYAPQYHTPHWQHGGVTYHIFVDRFRRAQPGPPTGRPGQPFYAHRRFAGRPMIHREGDPHYNYDFFGGDLQGIRSALGYLHSLGVTALYLSPVFEAASNHRYDTADYERIDPMLGSQADFTHLCADAHALGMHVILDGVFNHTGADSRYFNAYGRYPDLGAAQSRQSPYFAWYTFSDWPGKYESWWGVPSLPQVNEDNPHYQRYITGPEGVVARWMRAGADGWRLDVADELPDDFLEGLRATARAIKPDALIIGEVWEDASNKISYGQRRGYLQGAQLDGVTNYPWRDAIIGFLRGDSDASALREAVETLLEHYPLPAVRSLMNILGTHDTVRIINALACTQAEFAQDKSTKTRHRLDAPRRAQAKRLLMLAAALQYFLPGSPCVYYGDELALEGFEDPLNRAPFPWGRKSLARAPLRVSRSAWAALKPPRPRKRRYLYSQPDLDMLECYRALGRMRRQYRDFFAQGTFAVEQAQGRVFICAWRWGERCLRLRVNAASEPLAVREPGESTHVAGARYATGSALSALPGLRFAITLYEQPDPADT